MTFDIEIVLRHDKDAIVQHVAHPREPRDWTEDDVRDVLKQILLAVNRAGHPGTPDPEVSLRGFSWIVEPFDTGSVVLALEIPMGAAVAGPFDIDQAKLHRLVGRVIDRDDDRPPPTLH